MIVTVLLELDPSAGVGCVSAKVSRIAATILSLGVARCSVCGCVVSLSVSMFGSSLLDGDSFFVLFIVVVIVWFDSSDVLF